MSQCQSLPFHDLRQRDGEAPIDLPLSPLPSPRVKDQLLLIPTALLEVEKKDESYHFLQASPDFEAPGSIVEVVCEVEPQAAQWLWGYVAEDLLIEVLA